jgi:hypothetical protein
MFIALNNPSPSAGFEPINLGSNGKHANQISPEGDVGTTTGNSRNKIRKVRPFVAATRRQLHDDRVQLRETRIVKEMEKCRSRWRKHVERAGDSFQKGNQIYYETIKLSVKSGGKVMKTVINIVIHIYQDKVIGHFAMYATGGKSVKRPQT